MSGSFEVRKLTLRAGLVVVALILALGGSGCTRAARQPQESLAELKALRGRPVIVHFWASWCPPCLPELPQIIEFASRVNSAGWTVLAVATDAKPEAARAALPQGQSLPSNFKVVFDSDSKVAEAFGSFVFPETYWIDEKGEIRHKWVGPQDWGRIAESGALGAKF